MLVGRKEIGPHDIAVRKVGGRNYLAIGDGGNVVGICRLADNEGQAARQVARAILRVKAGYDGCTANIEGVE